MIPQTASDLRGVFVMKPRTGTWRPSLELLEPRLVPSSGDLDLTGVECRSLLERSVIK